MWLLYTKLKKLSVQEGKKDRLCADYVTQVCEAHDRVILSFYQQVQVLARPTTKRSGRMMTQFARANRCKEEHTLTERQDLGPSNDSGLRMVNLESKSKPEDGHIYCILLICVEFCHVSKNWSLHCLIYVAMNIYFCFYFHIACDVVTFLCTYFDIYHFVTRTYSDTHMQAHMHD